MRSIASALRNSTPAAAPRPEATMIDIGVARPRAQGQAMISTATALTRAWASRGSGPSHAQTTKVSGGDADHRRARTRPATWSARRWIGARLRWASATSCTMRASSVSLPTRSARITKLPLPFSVAPITRLAGPLLDGHRLAR